MRPPTTVLRVGKGQVFYCNKSKLLNANDGSSYFSARFREDSMLDAGLDRVDDEGRDIYKLDVDPIIFQYIMEYIDTTEKPKGIGVYEMNKQLWGLVREEALYFGLDSLVQLMKITFSCSPEVDEGLGASGEGIMYWLGTNKGTSDYVNPYTSGAVDITGWHSTRKVNLYISEEDKELMVQYRPSPDGLKSVGCSDRNKFGEIFSGDFGAMMGCQPCSDDSISFHLMNTVAVSPTHYSIRSGGCFGMSSDWNLEASIDEKIWDVIHESRGRSPLYSGIRYDERKQLWDRVKSCEGVERIYAVCDHMEGNHRHTWRVVNTSGKFYTHFRFVSIETPRWNGGEHRQPCLHGMGFEVFGEVYEEWEVEQVEEISQDRVKDFQPRTIHSK